MEQAFLLRAWVKWNQHVEALVYVKVLRNAFRKASSKSEMYELHSKSKIFALICSNTFVYAASLLPSNKTKMKGTVCKNNFYKKFKISENCNSYSIYLFEMADINYQKLCEIAYWYDFKGAVKKVMTTTNRNVFDEVDDFVGCKYTVAKVRSFMSGFVKKLWIVFVMRYAEIGYNFLFFIRFNNFVN